MADGRRPAPEGDGRVAVLVEATPRRCFASALEWPGWSRPGRDEDAALAALAASADRYAAIAAAAGHPLAIGPAGLHVVQRAEGTATTAFGAPDVRAVLDARPLDAAGAARVVSLVTAAWAALDAIAAAAPAELRKGPRGGGRDRDAVVAHVLAAETAYARVIGIRLPEPALGDPGAIAAQRAPIAALLAEPSDGSPLAGKRWPPRYAARRIAWHVLDHAWEIEDRSEA